MTEIQAIVRSSRNRVVTKRNVLNEMRSGDMTLQELRFLSFYLSKINPLDPLTRIVRLPLREFWDVLATGEQPNVKYLKRVTNVLLQRIVHIPNEDGSRGWTAFQLFKECRVIEDRATGGWFVEFDAHDRSLPMMFDFRERFFSYELWNALSLKSANQLRMYEILKQYEKAGARVLSLEELKRMLGIQEGEYTRYGNFRSMVLEPCRKALLENTDIRFTYEPYRRSLRGKILAIRFAIERNKGYVDRVNARMVLSGMAERVAAERRDGWSEAVEAAAKGGMSAEYRRRVEYLREASVGEFSFEETASLFNDMRRLFPPGMTEDALRCYDYLCDKYNELEAQGAAHAKVGSRLSYVRELIYADAQAVRDVWAERGGWEGQGEIIGAVDVVAECAQNAAETKGDASEGRGQGGQEIESLREALGGEFSAEETVSLFNDMRRLLPQEMTEDALRCYDYLCEKYFDLVTQGARAEIANRYAYLRGMIRKDARFVKKAKTAQDNPQRPVRASRKKPGGRPAFWIGSLSQDETPEERRKRFDSVVE